MAIGSSPIASTPIAAGPSQGQAPGTGIVNATLDGVTTGATGTLKIAGSITQTLADVTLAGTGTITGGGASIGSIAQTLSDATVAATGTLRITATLAQTLSDATVAATGALRIAATLAQTLAGATVSAAGTRPVVVQVEDADGVISRYGKRIRRPDYNAKLDAQDKREREQLQKTVEDAWSTVFEDKPPVTVTARQKGRVIAAATRNLEIEGLEARVGILRRMVDEYAAALNEAAMQEKRNRDAMILLLMAA